MRKEFVLCAVEIKVLHTFVTKAEIQIANTHYISL